MHAGVRVSEYLCVSPRFSARLCVSARAEDREPGPCEVEADLVPPAGDQPDLDKSFVVAICVMFDLCYLFILLKIC